MGCNKMMAVKPGPQCSEWLCSQRRLAKWAMQFLYLYSLVFVFSCFFIFLYLYASVSQWGGSAGLGQRRRLTKLWARQLALSRPAPSSQFQTVILTAYSNDCAPLQSFAHVLCNTICPWWACHFLRYCNIAAYHGMHFKLSNLKDHQGFQQQLQCIIPHMFAKQAALNSR